MYDLRNLPGNKHLCAAGLVLLGALCSFQVNAGAFSSNQSGNSVTYSSSSYGRDAAIAGAALAISGGAVYAAQSTTLRTAAGATAALALRAAPVAGAVGSAVLSCLGNPLCIVATGAAAALVANELSYRYSIDPVTGTPVIDRPVTETVGMYYVIGFGGTNAPTRTQSCEIALGAGAYVQFLGGGYLCFSRIGGGGYTVATISESSQTTNVPVTPAEFSQAIGAKTDWANDSKITDLLEKIVKNTSQSIPLQIPTVTGPTSIPGTPTVTTKADGSKTTTKTTSNLGYYGPRVDITDTTTVEETTPAGVTTTISTTTAPVKTEDVSKDEYDVPDVDIPKTKKTMTFNAENLGFAGGSCPANVTQNINGAPVVLFNWTSHCATIQNYAKPMILALATFAALMIIFGAKTE